MATTTTDDDQDLDDENEMATTIFNRDEKR